MEKIYNIEAPKKDWQVLVNLVKECIDEELYTTDEELTILNNFLNALTSKGVVPNG